MKKLIEEKEEGLIKLLNKRVTLLCCRYIYTGVLEVVNDTCVKLNDAGIVYDTGALDNNKWDDMQKLPNDWYVQMSSIESFGILK